MNPFNNPYSGQRDIKRITTDVSSADYYLIKSTRPGLATITATLGTLWQKLCYELRKRGITDFTHVTEFEQFVATCQIVGPDGDRGGLPNCATGGTNEASATPNVGGGTTQQSASGATATAVVPDLQKRGGKRSKRT